jgi:hypothetical protein
MDEWELEERLEGGTWEEALEIVRAREREIDCLRDSLWARGVLEKPDLPEDVRTYLDAVLESFPDLDIHLLTMVRRQRASGGGARGANGGHEGAPVAPLGSPAREPRGFGPASAAARPCGPLAEGGIEDDIGAGATRSSSGTILARLARLADPRRRKPDGGGRGPALAPRASTVLHASASPSRTPSTSPASGSTPSRSALAFISRIRSSTGAIAAAVSSSAPTPALSSQKAA